MCISESQEAMKCVPFDVNEYAYVKCSSLHAQCSILCFVATDDIIQCFKAKEQMF